MLGDGHQQAIIFRYFTKKPTAAQERRNYAGSCELFVNES